MISHDRYLLDAVVGRIVETEQGRLIEYPGDYTAFRTIRAERRLTQHRAYEKQQERFRKEEEYIRRFKAGQRARQAKGREARLEREKEQDLLERPMELAQLRLSLPKPPRSADTVATARDASKAYSAHDGSRKVLFEGLSLTISRGERWGIVGPNGAGKTTLVRTLMGEIPPDSGACSLGTRLAVGYFSQSHEHLDPDLTVIQQLQRSIQKESPGVVVTEQQARDLAGAFLFSGDDQQKQIRVLSGGERARVVLAALLAASRNLLILDEPTNHLDIPSAERLEEALSIDTGFDGTVVLISHDRALIDAVCDHLLVLDGRGGWKTVAGNYSHWRQREAERAAAPAPRQATRQSPGQSPGQSSRQTSGHAPGHSPYRATPPPAQPAPSPQQALVDADRADRGRIGELEDMIADIDRAGRPAVWPT